MSAEEKRRFESMRTATKTHFFDGQSKYISLKNA